MKKVMISFLAVFVVGSFSFAEVSDSSATNEVKAKLTKELNSAYQQQKEQVSINNDLNYPLLQKSCVADYITEQLKKDSNWKITRIKDNGIVQGKHSYTIISPSGWKTFRCKDDKYINAFIELNKNPKDYKTYLTFLKASRDLRHLALIYTAGFAGLKPEQVGSEDYPHGDGTLYLRSISNCSYNVKYLDVLDYKKSSGLSDKFQYLKCLRHKVDKYYDGDMRLALETLDATSYYHTIWPQWWNNKKIEVYMFPEQHNDGRNYILAQAPFHKYKCEELFFTDNAMDFNNSKTWNEVEKNKIVVPASAFKTLKTFKLNDYIDASSGVKCEGKIPDKIFKYIVMTEDKR